MTKCLIENLIALYFNQDILQALSIYLSHNIHNVVIDTMLYIVHCDTVLYIVHCDRILLEVRIQLVLGLKQ